MACYAYSVLTQWFSSVCSGTGSETPLSKEPEQVVIASPMTPMDVNDISSLETIADVPDSCQEPDRKGGDTAKVIIIPTETANYIMGHAHSAFVSTRSVSDMEDASISDGGAKCTLTKKKLENCTQCNPKVLDIQTAQGATLVSTTRLCLKTYYVRVQLVEISPIVVKAYVVPGLKYNL